MPDLSNLTDEQLNQLAESRGIQQASPQTSSPDLSSLSDEQLGELANSRGIKERSIVGEIARPFLQTAKNYAVGTVGTAGDLAQEAFNLPYYAGFKGAQKGVELFDKYVKGEKPREFTKKNFDPLFGEINSASSNLREGIDSVTAGLTAPRNKTEENIQTAGEVLSGAGGIIAKGAQVVGKAAESVTQSVIRGVGGIKPELIKVFKDAGISPRLADVSTSKPTKAFQNLLEVFPGSASTIQKATQNQIDDIAQKVANISGSEGGTIAQTGTKIKSGAKDFIKSIDDKSEKNFITLGEKVGQDTPIQLNNTLRLLEEQKIKDVAAIGDGSTDRVLRRIEEIAKDPTYNKIRILRSSVGKKSYSSNLGEDDRGAIKQIYGSLTEDMRGLAQSKGSDALNQFNKANNFYSTTTKYIDKNIQSLIKAKTPEKVYQVAFAGSNQGGTNLNRVLRILKPEQRDYVRGSVAREMGLQKSGLQNAEGDVFSSNKFLTEYQKLKRVGTDKYIFTPAQRESYLNLNKAISSVKETSKIAQTSNNLPYANWLGLIAATAASPVTATQAAGAVVGARISAELMTSPKFINWLAKAPKVPTQEIPKHLKALSVIASQNSALREDILDYLDSITIEQE